MKTRLLTALGMAIVGIPLLIFSKYIVYPIGLALLATMSAWEMLRLYNLHRKMTIAVPSYVLTVCLPVFSYKTFLGYVGGVKNYLLVMMLALFAFLLYLAFVSVGSKGFFTFRDVTSTFTSITYVVVSFTSMSLVRYMINGVYFFPLFFLGAWVTDTFAYFVGRAFGKHKLIPEISPKKTVEGAIGGMLFNIIAFLVYGFIIQFFFEVKANYLVLAVSGLILSVVAQLGDLWASQIKREHGVKDFSNILPGHGGIMDRYDSIISVSTVFAAICILFPPFGGV